MTVLLKDYYELEDRASKHLKVWKGWHVSLYVLAAIFGLLNYSFFQSTAQIFDNNCILFPRKLDFHSVNITNATASLENNNINVDKNNVTNAEIDDIVNGTKSDDDDDKIDGPKRKRDVNENNTLKESKVINNAPSTNNSRQVLYMPRSLFAAENDCQFEMFMPVLSTVFALAWATFFVMCPSGGFSRSGLRQPWRILTPALLFAIVMVGLTGHSFSQTNAGLQALCASFRNVTNTTTCSAVNEHVERAWNSTWSVGSRVNVARAASAGVWATWACACALLLARCLAAPDFVLRTTNVIVKHDPKQKITPYLNRSPKRASPNRKIERVTSVASQESSRISEPSTSSALVTSPTRKSYEPMSPNKNHELSDNMLELVYIPKK